MNDKKFDKTVKEILNAPLLQRVWLVDGLKEQAGDGLKPAQVVKLDRIREVARA